MVADACTELALPALSVAVLGYVPQLPADVTLATCTDAVPPFPRLPKLQLSVWPESEHDPGPPYEGLMLQAIPDPAGSVSLNITELAAAPLLPAARV